MSNGGARTPSTPPDGPGGGRGTAGDTDGAAARPRERSRGRSVVRRGGNEVIVARETNGVRTFEILDLTSKEIFNSPAFYLQQNDVVYVKPNKYKAQAGEISQNRSFYLSLVSTAISVATLIVTLTR